MLRRAAVLAVIAFAVACGAPPAPRAPKTAEQQLFDAANAALQCLSDRGATCLTGSAATTAWFAHVQLELIAQTPPPVLGARLLRAFDHLRNGNEGGRHLAELALEARPVAQDLSCAPTSAASLGVELRERRAELIRMAENLGLAATPLAPIVSELEAAARALDGATLVTARCRQGQLFVLLIEPRSELSADAIPDVSAPPARDWRPVAIATSRQALTEGPEAGKSSRAAVPIDDAPAPDGVDPWIPVGEIEL